MKKVRWLLPLLLLPLGLAAQTNPTCASSLTTSNNCSFTISGQGAYGPFNVPAGATTLNAQLSDAGITSTLTFSILTSTAQYGPFTAPSGCSSVTVAAGARATEQCSIASNGAQYFEVSVSAGGGGAQAMVSAQSTLIGKLTPSCPGPGWVALYGCGPARLTVPIPSTTTGNTFLAGSAIKIPAGSLSANSQIRIEADFARASGTGNCTGALWLDTTAGTHINLIGAPAAGPAAQRTKYKISLPNSLNNQNVTFDWTANGSTGTNLYTFTLNAANDLYINASQASSDGVTSCQITSETVELIP